MPTSPAKPLTRPIDRLAAAVARCPAESAAYGKCIVRDYNNVHKDVCAAEFMRLRECYLAHYRKR